MVDGLDGLCVNPPGIMEQGKRYLDTMRQPTKARIVDDRLHIVDRSDEVLLVFARQRPLSGEPVDLVGTSWRLVDDDAAYGEGTTTLFFLDSRAAYRRHRLPGLHRRVHGVQRAHPDAVQWHVRLHRAVLRGHRRRRAPVRRRLRLGE